MEKNFCPKSGYLTLVVFILLLAAIITAIVLTENPIFVIGLPFVILIAPGFIIVNPNESAVLILFGKYKGNH